MANFMITGHLDGQRLTCTLEDGVQLVSGNENLYKFQLPHEDIVNAFKEPDSVSLMCKVLGKTSKGYAPIKTLDAEREFTNDPYIFSLPNVLFTQEGYLFITVIATSGDEQFVTTKLNTPLKIEQGGDLVYPSGSHLTNDLLTAIINVLGNNRAPQWAVLQKGSTDPYDFSWTSEIRATEAEKLLNSRSLDGAVFDGTKNISRYGICTTDADMALKVVQIKDFILTDGSILYVRFNYSNTASSPTLTVISDYSGSNGYGPFLIKRYGDTSVGTESRSSWPAGAVVSLTYYEDEGNNSNSCWYLVDSNNTFYDSATTSSAGLMSATDKSRLDGIYNEINNVVVSNTTSTAAPSFGGTFTAIDSVERDTHGRTTAINTKAVTIPSAVATTTTAGLMSAADKQTIEYLVAGSVTSINGKTGEVTLDASDVGAIASINNISGTDITLTAANVGALPNTTFIPSTASDVGAFGINPVIHSEETCDMDSFLTGFHYFRSNCTLTNVPSGQTNGWLIVLPGASNVITQLWTSFTDNALKNRELYLRTRNGSSVWGSWAALSILAYGSGILIPQNSDLDNYLTPGVYATSSSSVSTTLQNSPTTSAFRMEVKVIANNASRLVQIVYANSSSNYIYSRFYTGSWSAWKVLTNPYDMYVTTSTPTTGSAPGIYLVYSS